MLTLRGEPFAGGKSRFSDELPVNPEVTAKVYVRIQAGTLLEPFLAQLDTGAAYSVLEPEIVEAIGASSDPGSPARLSVKGLEFDGRLIKIPITLLADEGVALSVDATVFVAANLPPGKNFLGYTGFLEAIRFAVDPQKNNFYFGPSS